MLPLRCHLNGGAASLADRFLVAPPAVLPVDHLPNLLEVCRSGTARHGVGKNCHCAAGVRCPERFQHATSGPNEWGFASSARSGRACGADGLSRAVPHSLGGRSCTAGSCRQGGTVGGEEAGTSGQLRNASQSACRLFLCACTTLLTCHSMHTSSTRSPNHDSRCSELPNQCHPTAACSLSVLPDCMGGKVHGMHPFFMWREGNRQLVSMCYGDFS